MPQIVVVVMRYVADAPILGEHENVVLKDDGAHARMGRDDAFDHLQAFIGVQARNRCDAALCFVQEIRRRAERAAHRAIIERDQAHRADLGQRRLVQIERHARAVGGRDAACAHAAGAASYREEVEIVGQAGGRCRLGGRPGFYQRVALRRTLGALAHEPRKEEQGHKADRMEAGMQRGVRGRRYAQRVEQYQGHIGQGRLVALRAAAMRVCSRSAVRASRHCSSLRAPHRSGSRGTGACP